MIMQAIFFFKSVNHIQYLYLCNIIMQWMKQTNLKWNENNKWLYYFTKLMNNESVKTYISIIFQSFLFQLEL